MDIYQNGAKSNTDHSISDKQKIDGKKADRAEAGQSEPQLKLPNIKDSLALAQRALA